MKLPSVYGMGGEKGAASGSEKKEVGEVEVEFRKNGLPKSLGEKNFQKEE